MSKTKTISLTVGAFVAGALISLHFPALADKEVKPGLPIDELRTFAEVYSAITQGGKHQGDLDQGRARRQG